MLSLFFYVFMAHGLAYIVGQSKISRPFRTLLYRGWVGRALVSLLECPACFGFWTGAAFGVAHGFWGFQGLGGTAWPASEGDPCWLKLLAVLGWGWFTSGTNLTLARLARPQTNTKG